MNTHRRLLPLLSLLACLALCAASGLASPTTGPATSRPVTPTTTGPAASRPATRPLVSASRPAGKQPSTKTAEERAKAMRLMQLTRRSIEFLEKKKFAEAEGALKEALALDPKHETNLYNMACLKALTGHPDDAMAFLEESAENGFTDFIHIEHDTDLTTLHELPRYKAFIGKKGAYQHRAAEAALAELRKQFGEGYLYEIDDEDKLIFATNTDQPTLDALKRMLVTQAHSQWDQIFANKPDQFIVVVVPSLVDYRKIVQMPGVEGFYSHANRTLIAKGLGFVTQHEFTHALHAADLDPLGQDHPIWLVEGMAVLFEHAEYDDGVLTPKDNMRLYSLQAAARLNRTIPFAKMLTMAQPEFVRRAEICYAQAGSMMHYLYDHQLLRPFYDKVKELYEKDKTGKLALEEVCGKPLEDIEKDWRAWMVKRTPPTMFTGRNGAYLGVQFEQANDGIRVANSVPGGPAFRAGVRQGDIIIGLNETDVRDVPTFMPLLAEHQPGERIVLKIRRGPNYLDVQITLGTRSDSPAAGRPPASRPAAKP